MDGFAEVFGISDEQLAEMERQDAEWLAEYRRREREAWERSRSIVLR